MTPEQLKASILQYAIQGKLVEQRPEEGTGEELYQRIQTEKQRLIKEGKIKKEKPLAEITDGEIPFDIPESWKWIKLGEVVSVLGGKRIPVGRTLTTDNTGYKYIRVSDMKDGSVLTDNLLYVPTDIYPSISRYVIHKEDVYITVAGTIGRVGKIPPEIDGANLTENADRLVFSIIDQDWLIRCLESSLVQQQIIDATTKVGQPKLAIKRIQELLIPLPPLAEQKRIVAKIEELLPYVDRYAAAYEKLEQFNAKFPEDMKKSILQYAIQGKLVEQRPEEGTGEELYRQIQYEKQRLIKEGKIKKEKPLPEISEDEVPFEIPDSWRWCYVGDLFNHNTGKAMNSSAKKTDKPGAIRPFITTSNVYWNSFDFSVVKEMFFSDDEVERCTVTKGDILMCEGGAYFGRTAIWNYDYDICFQNHVHRLRPYQEIDLMFFYHIFFFYKNMNMMKAKGTAMPGLSSITLHQMIIPLPPLAEQKRIVAKLEEILPLCERLK